jgi:hypothetical protein
LDSCYLQLFFSFTAFLVIVGTVGYKTHQCLAPQHTRTAVFPFSPENVKGIDLFVVAGSVSVHSCPYAKNITIVVTEGAHSSELLSEMSVQADIKDGIVEIAAMGPSFDWRHCQLSHVTVTLPKDSTIDLTARVIFGKIITHSHFSNLKLATSLGVIKTDRSKIAHNLDIQALAGYVSLKGTSGNISSVEVQNGLIRSDSSFFTNAYFGVGFGGNIHRGLLSLQSLEITTLLGFICSKHIQSSSIKAHVDYGLLRSQIGGSFTYTLKSQWGKVELEPAENALVTKISDTPYERMGVIGTNQEHRSVQITTTYGRAYLIADGEPKVVLL